MSRRGGTGDHSICCFNAVCLCQGIPKLFFLCVIFFIPNRRTFFFVIQHQCADQPYGCQCAEEQTADLRCVKPPDPDSQPEKEGSQAYARGHGQQVLSYPCEAGLVFRRSIASRLMFEGGFFPA